MIRLLCSMLLLTSCGSSANQGSESSGATHSSLSEGRIVQGCYVTDDAPDPYACQSAADCVAGGLLKPTNCCMSGITHAHSRAYHQWQMAVFDERCGGECMEPPSPPRGCETELQCVEGRCKTSCP